MNHAAQYLMMHGALVVFAWILVQQAGLPVPGAPVLISIGSLANSGRIGFLSSLAAREGAPLCACQGAGIGRRLLETTVTQARALGATRLYLETNSKLAPALRLYESMGFRRLPPERVTPSPYARSNVSMELSLNETFAPTLADSADSADAAPRARPLHSPPPSSTS